jgi:hypothetical protein
MSFNAFRTLPPVINLSLASSLLFYRTPLQPNVRVATHFGVQIRRRFFFCFSLRISDGNQYRNKWIFVGLSRCAAYAFDEVFLLLYFIITPLKNSV